jgi:hypothetical protein
MFTTKKPNQLTMLFAYSFSGQSERRTLFTCLREWSVRWAQALLPLLRY